MAARFKESQLTDILLRSKHLVVVLGKNNGPCHVMVPLTSTTGAGVSEAAGIQTFRGRGGLFSVSSPGHSGNILALFDKDTFQVLRQLALVLPF